MTHSIIMKLGNSGQQRASASATINGKRYRGLYIYENSNEELDFGLPYASKMPSSVRPEVKRALIEHYKKLANII